MVTRNIYQEIGKLTNLDRNFIYLSDKTIDCSAAKRIIDHRQKQENYAKIASQADHLFPKDPREVV